MQFDTTCQAHIIHTQSQLLEHAHQLLISCVATQWRVGGVHEYLGATQWRVGGVHSVNLTLVYASLGSR